MFGTATWVQQNTIRADGKPSVLHFQKQQSFDTEVLIAVEHVLDIARAAARAGMVIKSLFEQWRSSPRG